MKRLKYIVLMLVTIVLLAGCSADASTVNKAFVNSQLMTEIQADVQEQVQIVEELHRIGVITTTMKNNLDSKLNALVRATETLSSGDTNIGNERNEFVEEVIRSLSFFGDGPSGMLEATNVEKHRKNAESNTENYGSYIDMYLGYQTKAIIETTVYKNKAGYLNGVEPLYPFGPSKNSLITDIVDHLNSLEEVQVYYLNAAQVTDTAKFYGMRSKLEAAKADPSGDVTELLSYFTRVGKPITLANKDKEYTEDDFYHLAVEGTFQDTEAKGIKVFESNKLGGKRHVATYSIFKLDKEAILKAYSLDKNGSDLEAGVLIGNNFFVTRYPVAVFRGFQRHATETAKYIPVFTHPYFLQADGEYKTESGEVLSGSLFEGSSSSYVDSLTSGDKGTAETKRAYINLYTGVMSYDGETLGDAHKYMGLGDKELTGSFAVRGANEVYTLENNPTCITTVTPEDEVTYVFKPSEKLQIGKKTAVNPEIDITGENLPVVFLMEYLELLYSPGTVGSDAFTAYGRKVRLKEDSILSNEALEVSTNPLAYVIGEGVTPKDWANQKASKTNGLKITDFLDIDGFYEEDLSAKIKDVNSEPNTVTSSVRYIGGAPNYAAAGTIQSGDAASERSDGLPQIAAGSGIECVMRFGATSLNSADSSSTPKTPLYGITLYGNLYDRGLFSDWINVSGNANIVQWTKTLKELGYPNYILSDATLTEKMKGNYAFELNKDGIMNLDLDTVIEINKGLVEERKGTGVTLLRTSLLILGFALVSYVSVLLAAWSLDVNLDFGLNLLEKVSLGHFVAVRSLDEMPPPDPDSTTLYVDFRSLIFKCIAFAVVGVVLISIDPVTLIIKVLGSLDFAIKIISEKVFGTTIM